MSWHFDGQSWWWITNTQIILHSHVDDPTNWEATAFHSEPQMEPPVTQDDCNVAERETSALMKRLKK